MVLLFAQGNPIVQPPAPAPNITVRSEVTVQAPPPDPQAIADASTQSYQSIVVTLIAPTLVSWVDGLLNVPDFIRSTPPDLSYRNSAVRGLADIVRTAAMGLVVLAVLVVGISVMLGGQIPDNVGRLLFGVMLSASDLLWWELGIDLNNAINAGITAPPIADLIRPHLSLPAVTADPVAAFSPAILVIVYAVVALLLLVSLAFRLGLIDILIAVGPLALLCASTEQSQGLYQRYVTLAVGTLFSQVLIVVALRLSPILGTLVSGVAGTILGIVVLLLARQMPSMLASGGARQGNSMSIGMLLLLRRAILRR
jgi:hypothetical protein